MTVIDKAVDTMMEQKGAAWTAGFLTTQLKAAVEQLPKSKQKMFFAQFEHVVGYACKATVKNCLTGQEVEIPWNQVGGPCDPSTERYHSM
jgi:hypothetical protein